ncbi:LacI family DNA-binding transcriptional regulator [Anaerotruncus rubiinfantis]|uniref:LacI family DNA-binding transcriptional regulator n=1 Tax=Anaerotruncus rubiinfantis TaxID=1720200 RepID=UPI001899DFD1|nr:LacI family DNA-binding transcriptional regulator [Anaerotruncus rubiinfantis]
MNNLTTIADIAKMAGVGKATVSRVINNSGYVKEETREKILKIMQGVSYRPSSVARNLSKNQSDLIALIVPQIENPFYAEVIKGISSILDENGFTLLICNTDNNAPKDLKALETVSKQRVAGFIYTPTMEYTEGKFSERFWDFFASINIPCVLLDRLLIKEGFKVDAVLSDNFAASYLATSALIKAGHTIIGAMIPDQSHYHYIARERYNGFQKAVKDYGLKRYDRFILSCNEATVKQAYLQAKALLSSGDYPTAMFCGNNVCSNGFFKAIFELGFRVPEDIAYIGYDELPSLELLGDRFSCLDRDLVGMGREVASLLIRKIENPQKSAETIFIPSLLRLKGSERLCEGKE